MKAIVAGSRNYGDTPEQYNYISGILNSFCPGHSVISEVVCGMATGVDMAGHKWATGKVIPIQEFPADWKTYGKRAGVIRNECMANYAEVLIAFWDGKSKGTKNMINTALDKGLEVHVYQVTV